MSTYVPLPVDLRLAECVHFMQYNRTTSFISQTGKGQINVSDVNKDFTFKAKDKAKDQPFKAKDQEQD